MAYLVRLGVRDCCEECGNAETRSDGISKREKEREKQWILKPGEGHEPFASETKFVAKNYGF